MPRDVLRSQTSFSPHLSPHFPRILTPTLHNSKTHNAGAQTTFASQVLSMERTQMLHSAASQALGDLKFLRTRENAAEENSWSKIPRRFMRKKIHLDSESATLGHNQMGTPASIPGNEPTSTHLSTAGNEQMSMRVSTLGNDQTSTHLSTAGNEQMSTRVSTLGKDQTSTRGPSPGNDRMSTRVSTKEDDPMFSDIGVSTRSNDPTSTDVSTSVSDPTSAGVTPMEVPGGLRITPLQVGGLRLDPEMPKGSVIVTSPCQVSTASSKGMMGSSLGQKTQVRGARSGSQQDTGTQTLESVGTQTSRQKLSLEKPVPHEASACLTRPDAWELREGREQPQQQQNASTQTQRDVRALWWKDKMTATVHEAETQTNPLPPRRRILVLSDHDAQTEAAVWRRDVGKSVPSQRLGRSTADDATWRSHRPSTRVRGRAHKPTARGVGGA